MVDRGARQAGDLGAQLVADAAARPRRCRRRRGPRDRRPRCRGGPDRRSAPPRPALSASARMRARSAVDVALGLADLRGLGGGGGLVGGGGVELLGSSRCGPLIAFLIVRPGVLPQQEEDDQRGEGAEQRSRALWPERVRRRLRSMSCSPRRQRRPVTAMMLRTVIVPSPRRPTRSTTSASGRRPVASSPARPATSATAAWTCCSAAARAASASAALASARVRRCRR